MASSQMAAKPKKPFNLRKWLKSREGQQAVVIVAFSIIPLALLFIFTYYPFAEMFKFSFYKMKYVGERQFVGLKNYIDVFTREFVFDTVLQWLGFELENLPYWLKDRSINNISLVGTSVWKYFGQNMVLFLGAMMSVDSELYEAAMLDGANKWQQFKYIMLPSIKTIVTLNLITSITGSLSAFEPPFVIMSGGANGTATYFVKMNEVAHTSQKVGLASAMAIVLLMIIFIATILQKVFMNYVFRSSEDEDVNAAKRREKKLAKARAKEARN